MQKFEFKKSLGQNFIIDETIIDKIIKCSNIDKDTLVIEIGPGSGVLSKKILNVSKEAILYEIDARLEKILNTELVNFNNYELYIKDFLKTNLSEDIKNHLYKKLFVVANLPYYITTPIINKIIEEKVYPDKMILMVQKEVGERLSSLPNNSEYGYITAYLNYYYKINKLFEVKKESFNPMPSVDSMVIEFIKLERDNKVENINYLKKLLQDSFKFKRKNIKNNLKNYDLTVIEKVLHKYDLDLSSRSENVSIDIFIEIANELYNKK